MSYVIYIVDTETTGQDPEEHDVIEVSFWRLSDDNQKTWCIKAMNPETITEKALYINKHKREDILHHSQYGRETYLEPVDAIEEIEAWIMDDDATVEERAFVGHNPEFDFNFLKKLWEKAGSPNTFPFKPFIIDTLMLTRLIDLCTGKRRPRYNLGSLVKDFKITKVTAHRAAGDTKMTKDLFVKQFDAFKDVILEKLADNYSTE